MKPTPDTIDRWRLARANATQALEDPTEPPLRIDGGGWTRTADLVTATVTGIARARELLTTLEVAATALTTTPTPAPHAGRALSQAGRALLAELDGLPGERVVELLYALVDAGDAIRHRGKLSREEHRRAQRYAREAAAAAVEAAPTPAAPLATGTPNARARAFGILGGHLRQLQATSETIGAADMVAAIDEVQRFVSEASTSTSTAKRGRRP